MYFHKFLNPNLYPIYNSFDDFLCAFYKNFIEMMVAYSNRVLQFISPMDLNPILNVIFIFYQ